MLKLLYKTLLVISTVIYLPLIYFIQNDIFVINGNTLYSIAFYILIIFLLNVFCLFLIKFLSIDSIENYDVDEYCSVGETYASIYFGYFFTALSIKKENYTLLFIIVLLVFAIVFSLDYYYNPILTFVFKYKYYHIKFKNGKKILIITKKSITCLNDCCFKNLYRINDYSYIDKGD